MLASFAYFKTLYTWDDSVFFCNFFYAYWGVPLEVIGTAESNVWLHHSLFMFLLLIDMGAVLVFSLTDSAALSTWRCALCGHVVYPGCLPMRQMVMVMFIGPRDSSVTWWHRFTPHQCDASSPCCTSWLYFLLSKQSRFTDRAWRQEENRLTCPRSLGT